VGLPQAVQASGKQSLGIAQQGGQWHANDVVLARCVKGAEGLEPWPAIVRHITAHRPPEGPPLTRSFVLQLPRSLKWSKQRRKARVKRRSI
jgi:hypothetical protein